MSARYSVNGNCLNTASATLPLANVVNPGSGQRRPQIADLLIGSDATPADNAAKYQLQRCTTAGTWAGSGGAAITPQAINPADIAAVTLANQGVCSAGPTLTASAFMLTFSVNQRATFRWVAAPGYEIIIPATASNGIALMSQVVGGSAVNTTFCFLIEE